jgi:hypothetical protein
MFLAFFLTEMSGTRPEARKIPCTGKHRLPAWAKKTPDFDTNWQVLDKLLKLVQLLKKRRKQKPYELMLCKDFSKLFHQNTRDVRAPDLWTENITALLQCYDEAKATWGIGRADLALCNAGAQP